jgi:hypothetical protein
MIKVDPTNKDRDDDVVKVVKRRKKTAYLKSKSYPIVLAPSLWHQSDVHPSGSLCVHEFSTMSAANFVLLRSSPHAHKAIPFKSFLVLRALLLCPGTIHACVVAAARLQPHCASGPRVTKADG